MTGRELRLLDAIVKANPAQQVTGWCMWRWGPPWCIGDRYGRWAVYDSMDAAIRVEHDASVPVVHHLTFGSRLEYWRNGDDRRDDALAALDVRVTVPERIAIPAGASLSRPLAGSVEDALSELNTLAHRELDAKRYDAPEGCPPEGSWIRAMKYDDDLIGRPLGVWHRAGTWDTRCGRFGVRCSTRAGRDVCSGLEGRGGMRLAVMADQPAEGACRRCILGIERDAATGAPEAQA